MDTGFGFTGIVACDKNDPTIPAFRINTFVVPDASGQMVEKKLLNVEFEYVSPFKELERSRYWELGFVDNTPTNMIHDGKPYIAMVEHLQQKLSVGDVVSVVFANEMQRRRAKVEKRSQSGSEGYTESDDGEGVWLDTFGINHTKKKGIPVRIEKILSITKGKPEDCNRYRKLMSPPVEQPSVNTVNMDDIPF